MYCSHVRLRVVSWIAATSERTRKLPRETASDWLTLANLSSSSGPKRMCTETSALRLTTTVAADRTRSGRLVAVIMFISYRSDISTVVALAKYSASHQGLRVSISCFQYMTVLRSISCPGTFCALKGCSSCLKLILSLMKRRWLIGLRWR